MPGLGGESGSMWPTRHRFELTFWCTTRLRVGSLPTHLSATGGVGHQLCLQKGTPNGPIVNRISNAWEHENIRTHPKVGFFQKGSETLIENSQPLGGVQKKHDRGISEPHLQAGGPPSARLFEIRFQVVLNHRASAQALGEFLGQLHRRVLAVHLQHVVHGDDLGDHGDILAG